MIDKIKTKKGFTLVELMVSLAIIIILVSLAAANYNIGFSQNNLINAQSMVYQNIRLAQSYALSYRSYNDVLPENWGLYFAKGSSSVIFYADLNGDYEYNEGEADSFLGGKEIALPRDITIDYISWSKESLNVLFEVGSGEMTTFSLEAGYLDSLDWQVELKDFSYDVGKIISLSSLKGIDIRDCSCNNPSGYCCNFCLNKDNCIDIETP